MNIVIASGKGGTGKTTFAVNLAASLAEGGANIRLFDCDVEEPNCHLFLRPDFDREERVVTLQPIWAEDRCIHCGRCASECRYNALAAVGKQILVFPELCHSCGVCSYVCPAGAFTETQRQIGVVRLATMDGGGQFVDGVLDVGEVLAPTVVNAVLSHTSAAAINIIDAPPGTGCQVVATMEKADVAVLVTEPTPFGLHDLKLAVSLAAKLGVPMGILINRADTNDILITEYADAAGVPIVGRIPFKRSYAETYSSGEILIRQHTELREVFADAFTRIQALVGTPVASIPEETDFPHPQDGDGPEAASETAHSPVDITVISGKGGTGKTTITACFSRLAEPLVLSDVDVDASNLHLLINPRVRESHCFVGGSVAGIVEDRCIGCGKCDELCRFGAVFSRPENVDGTALRQISPHRCEGCGLCQIACPVGAVQFRDSMNGHWFVSDTNGGPMTHARLGIGEENSGRLVTQVRKKAQKLAAAGTFGQILNDGAPGTGCPVIASITGSDLVVIVTEPTVSGVHDLNRVLALCRHFSIRAAVIINKADLNENQSARISETAGEHAVPIVGEVPFDPTVQQALMQGKVLLDYGPGLAGQAIRHAWQEIRSMLSGSL